MNISFMISMMNNSSHALAVYDAVSQCDTCPVHQYMFVSRALIASYDICVVLSSVPPTLLHNLYVSAL